jgi:hypothetical protein
MLVCDPRRIVSNVDRMAYDHLVAARIIYPNKAGRPKIENELPKRKIGWEKKGRVGWKKLGSMRKGGACQQCGDAPSQVPVGLPKSEDPKLCDRCFAVLAHSRRYWIASEDFPVAG